MDCIYEFAGSYLRMDYLLGTFMGEIHCLGNDTQLADISLQLSGIAF